MAKKHKPSPEIAVDSASATAVTDALRPNIVKVPVTDAATLDQSRIFAEALKQTQSLAPSDTPHASRVAKTIHAGTARPRGISPETAKRYATSSRTLDAFFTGANPTGKAAEVVAASDYRAVHAGHETGIVNPPKHVAQNFVDIKLAFDPASRKDLLFAFETKTGDLIWKYNGQVKTGKPQYVADSLIKMSRTPGYGKIGYIDSGLVNPDGTARVGPGAFTKGQAKRLQEAKVRLRGIPNLEDRAAQFMVDIKASRADGLDPLARHQLRQLRDDIAFAYKPRGVAGRIGGGAAVAAASAAVVSLVVQFATNGQIDAKALGHAAGTGAVFGAAGAAADAGLYHLATNAMSMSPEAAQAFAQHGVAGGFCVLAIATDLFSEVGAARRGDVTVADATSGAAVKTALDLLPLVMGPLGLVGLPILVIAQVGGRWLLTKARDADRELSREIASDAAFANKISARLADFSRAVDAVNDECSSTDERFLEVMGGAAMPPTRPALHIVKG